MASNISTLTIGPKPVESGNTGIVGPQQTVIPNKPKLTPNINPIWFVVGAALLLFYFWKK